MLGSVVGLPCAKPSRGGADSRSSSKRFATEMIIRRWGGRKWLGGDRRKKSNQNGGSSSSSSSSDGDGSNGLQRPSSRESDEPIENQDWRRYAMPVARPLFFLFFFFKKSRHCSCFLRYRAQLVASEGCYEGCFVPDADSNDNQVWAHTVSVIEPGCLLLAKPVLTGRKKHRRRLILFFFLPPPLGCSLYDLYHPHVFLADTRGMVYAHRCSRSRPRSAEWISGSHS